MSPTTIQTAVIFTIPPTPEKETEDEQTQRWDDYSEQVWLLNELPPWTPLVIVTHNNPPRITTKDEYLDVRRPNNYTKDWPFN